MKKLKPQKKRRGIRRTPPSLAAPSAPAETQPAPPAGRIRPAVVQKPSAPVATESPRATAQTPALPDTNASDATEERDW